MALTRENLLQFLKKSLRLKVETLADTTAIFSSGMADSFMLMSLLTFVEKEQATRVNVADVTLENLDTIESILAFASKLQPAQ